MAAMTRTEVAKVVRRVLGEEQGDTNEATLKALERVNQLLRERVIPQLPEEEANPDEPFDDDEVRSEEVLEEEEPSQPSIMGVSAKGYPYQPCRKGGPSAADNKLATQLRPKLHGTLRNALDGQRICCARQIVNAVKARRMHRRAAAIAVTTAIVESTLLNINQELDHDSLGLFQQRASWGSRANRLNPTWSTNAFLNAMLQKYPRNSWFPQPIGKVCQRVQVSAYPGRYQVQVPDAFVIVWALWRVAKPAAADQTSATRTMSLAEEPGAEKDETLQAIEHFRSLLTEEVIPRLSGDPDTESEPDESDPDEMPGDDSPDTQVPSAVTEALRALYQRLSADQAQEVAQLFNVIADHAANGAEEEPADDDEVEAPVH